MTKLADSGMSAKELRGTVGNELTLYYRVFIRELLLFTEQRACQLVHDLSDGPAFICVHALILYRVTAALHFVHR